ncbi:hypothetical protein Cgig2_003507 [Carnegiea gigantea]|uniref:PB1-like domain-containing protein n=1 Tax=Carnegiea gigantea TaxID=171969 RepID=A0A9Q1GJX0_9CARY|nr:hypothetical protein Cgig2_003507 [Carnegiea gigantea]
MSVDDILVEIHPWEKFVDGDKVEYVGGGVSEIEPVDIDRLSRFKIIGLAKDIGFTNVEEFYYLIPRMSLRERLRTCHNDFESLDMAAALTVPKRLVVYLVHRVDVPKEVVPEILPLPWPFMATQQSNVDPMSSSIKDGQECDQKGVLDGSTSTFGSQNSRGTRVKQLVHTTQKAHSHDTTPIFNVNNEHVPEWDWKDTRPESPILCDKLIKGESLMKSLNDGNEHDWDTNIQDEWEADVEDPETSDEEWAATKAKVGSSFHSDYENSEAEMNTDGETDGDVPRLLRKKEKPIKVDEHTDFKKLKWKVGMTFGIVPGFKDAISRFGITQGNYKSADHNKKGCPQPAEFIHGNPPPQKRQWDRLRKQPKLLSELRE